MEGGLVIASSEANKWLCTPRKQPFHKLSYMPIYLSIGRSAERARYPPIPIGKPNPEPVLWPILWLGSLPLLLSLFPHHPLVCLCTPVNSCTVIGWAFVLVPPPFMTGPDLANLGSSLAVGEQSSAIANKRTFLFPKSPNSKKPKWLHSFEWCMGMMGCPGSFWAWSVTILGILNPAGRLHVCIFQFRVSFIGGIFYRVFYDRWFCWSFQLQPVVVSSQTQPVPRWLTARYCFSNSTGSSVTNRRLLLLKLNRFINN